MDHRLLAATVFSSDSSASSKIAQQTSIDAQNIIFSILLKFLDVLEGAGIIILSFVVMRYIKKYFAKIETAHERQRTALNLLEKITNGFVIIMGVTLGLKVIGLDLTLIISVLTLGLSFGLRDVIKNYVAGLLILFKSPFEIGDIVQIRKFTGRIEKIEFQSITIKTFENKEVTIHNSDLLTQPITNFSKNDFRRLLMNISVGYGTDLKYAMKVFERILFNHPEVLKTPPYSIIVKNFSDTSMLINMRFWVEKKSNPLRIRSEIALQLQEAFDEQKIFAPYSRQTEPAQMFSMNEARKQRLSAFYGQPILADIAGATSIQIGLVAAPAEEYVDAQEPE